jgi:hypothetical protein
MLRMHARRHDKGFDRETVILGRPLVRRLFDLLNMQSVVRVVESLDDAMQRQRFAPKVRYAFCGNAGTTARKRDHQA